MESIVFSRNAYKSAICYYDYLKEAHLGKETINVVSIIRLKECKYRLFLSKKIFHIDSIEFKINSALFPSMELDNTDISIFEYDEQNLSIVAHTSQTISHIFEQIDPNEITLESDLTFLVKTVRNWYREYHDRIHPPSENLSFLNVIPRPNTASNEQYQGLCSILTSPISYVWGAPGTGKTQMVLANALLYYANSKQYTLLMAPTNNALEQSLRGVLSVMDEKSISHNVVMRLGKATSDFLLEYPEVCEADSYDAIGDTIRENLDRLKEYRNKQIRYEALTEAARNFTLLYESFQKIRHDIESSEETEKRLTKKLHKTNSKILRHRESFDSFSCIIEDLTEKLKKQERYLYVISLYSRYNEIIEQHQTDIQAIATQIFSLETSRKDAQATVDDLSNRFSMKSDELFSAQKKFNSISSKIKFAFSKDIKQRATHTLNQIKSEYEIVSQNLSSAKSNLFRIIEQIKSLEEEITRKELLLAGNPRLFEISKELFSKNLSCDELKIAFEAELSPFSSFTPDDALNKKLSDAIFHQSELNEYLCQTEAVAAQLSTQLEQIESDNKLLQQQICQLSTSIEDIAKSIYDQPLSPSDLERHLTSELSSFGSFETIPNIDDLITEKEISLGNLLSQQRELLKNRYIIACTVDYAMLHYDNLINGVPAHFAQIFVDEAAYCPLIKAGVFFSFDAPVALLGDHMQLPPICEMNRNSIMANDENQAVFLWDMSAIYFPDIFIENYDFNDLFLSYVSNSSPKFQNVEVTFLTKTFRFGELLAKVLDKFVYHQGFHGSSGKQIEIILLDAKKSNRSTAARESREEALAIKQFLEDNKPNDYIIMSPYKAQCRTIEQELQLPRGSVLTVHASQGREWDTVILSVTDGHDKFFMDSKNIKSNGLRIVNTAVSRAKTRIVLALDYDKWKYCTDQLITNIAQQNTLSLN